MAITSSFSSGVLNVNADTLDNTLLVSRNAAGQLLVNNGAQVVIGGIPTVANTARVDLFGRDGNDTLTLSENNGALPAAHLFGGNGNDVLSSGSGNDQLFGEAGNDTLLGRGGFDLLFGGSGNDTLTGGDADDQLFGQAGDDRMIWNPGDDTDLHEGGAGNDTSEVNAGNGGEQFVLTSNGTRVRFDRTDPAPFSLDIGTTENLVVNMNGGNDSFTAIGNLAAQIRLTVDGGAGDDTIRASNGADVLLGGDGNDFIDGQQGNDVALLGNGDDTFQWDPGDGNDVIEGQDGTDLLVFNASAANEILRVAANGPRALLTRNVANVTMDLNGVERIDLRAFGGADNVEIADLSATEVREVAVDLGVADFQADSVSVTARNVADGITIGTSGTETLVAGLSARVRVLGAEATRDALSVNAGAGNDTITATNLSATGPRLTIDAGAGNDTVNGGQGADLILGGSGDDRIATSAGADLINGGSGNDTVFMGSGDDRFVWNPGDGNDVIDGQAGFDTHEFNGSAGSESLRLFANGERATLTRNLGNVTLNQDNVERVQIAVFGGSDIVEIEDLRATDVREVLVDLADPANDTTNNAVVVEGGTLSNSITVTANGSGVLIGGLATQTRITNASGNDALIVDGEAGNDVINASSIAAGTADFALLGRNGDDTLIAGRGGMTLFGGAGNDTLVGGSGNDRLEGGSGLDVLFGGAGNDTFEGDDDFIIRDFRAGAGSEDRIDLTNVAGIDDFGDVLAVARNVSGGAILDFGDDEIGLVGVSVGQLHQDDFLI